MQHEPDREEKAIRFGCGALFGVALGVYESTRFLYRRTSAEVAIAVIVGFGVVSGYLAMKYGDRFWENRWW